jgi:hypothetical protein
MHKNFRLRLDQIERLAREPNASAVVRDALDQWWWTATVRKS